MGKGVLKMDEQVYRPLRIIRPVQNQSRHLRLFYLLAAWLGLVAVLVALVLPVSRLANDVRTGQLSGVCSLVSSLSGDLGASSNPDDAQPKGSHCDMCGSVGLALLPQATVFALPVQRFALSALVSQAVLPASPFGLPFGRGPPLG